MNEDLSQLTLVELLDLLEPVPEPAPIPLFPQTAGWLVLGLVAAAAAGWLGYRWVRARRRNAYRRAALSEIAKAGDDPAALALILRRTALAAYPRAAVAGLHGEAWLSFLETSGDGTAFRQGPGRAIATAPYASSGPVPGIAELAARWVRRHRSAREASR